MASDNAAKSANGVAMSFVLLGLCCVSGCYDQVTQGNQALYHCSWWVGPLIIAGGCLTIVLGWVLRKWTPKWGFVLICMGPFLLIIVAPAMYSDYVLIDDEHFETSYGFWFSPTVQNLRFKELREIRFVEVPRRRGGTEIELQCITHAGEIHVVHGGSLVTNTVPEMLARAKAKGVLVPNQIP